MSARHFRRDRWAVGVVWKLPGMMDTLDNSSLFFLQMFTQHQLSLKPLSITLTHPPPLLLPSPSNELFSSGDGTGTQSNHCQKNPRTTSSGVKLVFWSSGKTGVGVQWNAVTLLPSVIQMPHQRVHKWLRCGVTDSQQSQGEPRLQYQTPPPLYTTSISNKSSGVHLLLTTHSHASLSRHSTRFPLHDKPRLQKWVDNMKREDWTPSRHQYLCSEHFTEDCFDIRWGIRYLKNTAVPTVFPLVENDGENKGSIVKRNAKAKPSEPCSLEDLTGLDSALCKRPLILSRPCKKVQSTLTNNTVAGDTEVTFELPLVLGTGVSSHSDHPETQTHTDAYEIVADNSVQTAESPCSESCSEDQIDSTVTVLCCQSLDRFSDGEAALCQSFSFVPMEMVGDDPAGCFLEESGPRDGEHVSVYEHSYCRPHTDKDQLWGKIVSLHTKILELDRREESTMAKIHALETEIAILKKDGAVFKEKQKVLEEYISTMVL
ncbi:THAP domain-containing protein 5-like isoform X2 [Betta splendens]|uniref:THAP domain-containing protein 5 n=1 Tax=Betta splendens TaxID=158456 RepID=A0A9W2Y0H3_BETSP|nr:THAP domain-containing protein 5-like isoform X2 [Betta splendens]